MVNVRFRASSLAVALAISPLSGDGLAQVSSSLPYAPSSQLASFDTLRIIALLTTLISMAALGLVLFLVRRGRRTRREVDEMRKALDERATALEQQNSQVKVIEDTLKAAVTANAFEQLKARVTAIEDYREKSHKENSAVLVSQMQESNLKLESRISSLGADVEALKKLVNDTVENAGNAQQAGETALELDHVIRRLEYVEALLCTAAFPNPDEPRMLSAPQIDRLAERIGGLADEARWRLAAVPQGDFRRLAGCIHETVLTQGARDFVLNAVEGWLREVTSGRIALIRPTVNEGKPTLDRIRHAEVDARPTGGPTGRIVEVRRPGVTVDDDIVYRAEVVVTV